MIKRKALMMKRKRKPWLTSNYLSISALTPKIQQNIERITECFMLRKDKIYISCWSDEHWPLCSVIKAYTVNRKEPNLTPNVISIHHLFTSIRYWPEYVLQHKLFFCFALSFDILSRSSNDSLLYLNCFVHIRVHFNQAKYFLSLFRFCLIPLRRTIHNHGTLYCRTKKKKENWTMEGGGGYKYLLISEPP